MKSIQGFVDELLGVDVKRPQHYVKGADGAIRRRTPKLRGKAVVKAAKRARQRLAGRP